MNARAGAKPDERFEKILETVLVATNVVPALELLNKSVRSTGSTHYYSPLY
jgi:hypothetical protein